MMLHIHTKFENKMFGGLEDIIWTNITIIQTSTDILNFHCDHDLKHSNPIFPQNTPAYEFVLSNQVWLQTNQQFRRYNRNSLIWMI